MIRRALMSSFLVGGATASAQSLVVPDSGPPTLSAGTPDSVRQPRPVGLRDAGSVRAVGGSPIWSFHVDGASVEYSWFYGIGNETGHPLGDNDYRAREARVVIAPSV